MPTLDSDGRALIATLGPLPVTLACELMASISDTLTAAGATNVTIGSNLRIVGTLPDPADDWHETHRIKINACDVHDGMLTWTCSCYESADSSFSDLGRAAGDAAEHVPAGEPWTITPARVPAPQPEKDA